MAIRIVRCVCLVALLSILGATADPAWATLPTPSQPILVVQNSSSSDPYQNFVPELLSTEGLNGFQTAQLPELTAAFLASYDVVILPHLPLTSAQATLFQNYVNAGGTLVGFRPDLQLATVFGVASLGTTLSEGWLKIDTSAAYGAGLDSSVMKFHGAADLYSLSGATVLATLYNSTDSPTSSPAAAIYSFGLGKAILFSFDLTQSNVLMRQGNPAWAGYPNNHDGYNTLRASQMFMDQSSGPVQFWNDLGDGALNDVPQADIQLRLFSNALVLSNAAKRPLPRFWYFPSRNRALLLFTGDQHGDSVSNSVSETNAVASAGGKFSNFLWYPFGAISNTQVNTWLAAGHAMEIHFNDTAEIDASGVGGSAASWSGMQSVLSAALTSFAATYPTAPAPTTTREHFLIWVSRNAAGTADQTAQAKLSQAAGIQLDTSYSSFPNRWGYMNGSGLPMKFLDTATGTLIPVFEQATQYEDDIQLSTDPYSVQWDLATAQNHYQKSLSDSLTKYNTVVTMLFHPDHWSTYSAYAQTVLNYAQSNSIPMYTTTAWLKFWKGRAATTLSMPSFSSNTLAFTATGSPAGLTLLVPDASGTNKMVSTFKVDGVTQSFTTATYQGVLYASVVLTAGTHNVSVTYTAAGRISGQISPSAAAASTTIQVQGGSTTQTVPVAADGTYTAGPFPAGTFTVTPSSSSNFFTPSSRSVSLNTVDITNVNFSATDSFSGETLFTTQTPALTHNTDGTNHELGTAFTADVAGQITGIRFWKDSNESGTHIGKIWSATGQLLATVTFTGETASGWQRQSLLAPLSIVANTKYIVSFNTSNTFYVGTNNELATQIVNGDLSSVAGNNGIYGSAGQFPTNSYLSTNYYADVFFALTPANSLASISLNPATVIGGTSSSGTVTLTNPAPTGGAVVVLSDDSASATTPASVTVPAGATNVTFTITTSVVSSATTVTVTGTYNVTKTATLTLNPATSLASVSLNPVSVVGGNSSRGTVTLTNPAPKGGVTVSLSSSSTLVQVPTSVKVAAGSVTANFTVTTSGTTDSTVATVAATYSVTQTATLTVAPATLSTLSLNPASLLGGNSSTGTVTLTGAAPAGGAVVALSSSSALATLPASVTVQAGSTGATFTVVTSTVSVATTVTISGTYGGTKSASLAVNPPSLITLRLSSNNVKQHGTSVTGTVQLNGPALAGGAVVTLASSNTSAATLPSSVTIAAGATSATFTVNTLSATSAVYISATFDGTTLTVKLKIG